VRPGGGRGDAAARGRYSAVWYAQHDCIAWLAGAEQWLRRVLVGLQLDGCKAQAAVDFLSPREKPDFALAEAFLLAATPHT